MESGPRWIHRPSFPSRHILRWTLVRELLGTLFDLTPSPPTESGSGVTARTTTKTTTTPLLLLPVMSHPTDWYLQECIIDNLDDNGYDFLRFNSSRILTGLNFTTPPKTNGELMPRRRSGMLCRKSKRWWMTSHSPSDQKLVLLVQFPIDPCHLPFTPLQEKRRKHHLHHPLFLPRTFSTSKPILHGTASLCA